MSRKSKAELHSDELQQTIRDIIYGQPDVPAPSPSDLVHRLRIGSCVMDKNLMSIVEPKLIAEAANRIEQLEALITLIEDLDPNVMNEARTALEGKNG